MTHFVSDEMQKLHSVTMMIQYYCAFRLLANYVAFKPMTKFMGLPALENNEYMLLVGVYNSDT